MARRQVARESRSPADADVDRLYGLPLREFTRARNALAARLKKAGRANGAAEVQRLQKPSAPVWTVNQAVRQDRPAAERFIQAVEHLRTAQAARPGELAAATAQQRAEMDRFMARARAALTSAGFRDSSEMLARVSKTLLGAAVRSPAALRGGRLTEELSLPGFEALAGVPTELAERPDEIARRARGPQGESAKDRQARERQERAREAIKVAEAEAEDWENRAEKLEQAAKQHRDTLMEAEAVVKNLRGQLDQVEERATDARRLAEQAAREADRARGEAQRASAKLKAARQALSARY